MRQRTSGSAGPVRKEIVLHQWGRGGRPPSARDARVRWEEVREGPVRVRHVRVLDRGDLVVALLLVLAVSVTNQGAAAVFGCTVVAIAARHLLGGPRRGGRHRLRADRGGTAVGQAIVTGFSEVDPRARDTTAS